MTPRFSLSLLDYLSMVPDARSEQGKRYPLRDLGPRLRRGSVRLS
jgi:hypothetical protein